MTTGLLTVQGVVSGGPEGPSAFNPLTITAPNAVHETLPVALAPGNNTIALPAGTTAVIIVPPNAAIPTPNPSYGGVLTLKGVAGDTGFPIDNKFATGPIPTSAASIVINATVACTIIVWSM